MHYLFLGIAQWIIKHLWIEEKKITIEQLKIVQERCELLHLPTDFGRILTKIAMGEGFSGFTTDQWKNFIMIFAIPTMWDMLQECDRKILENFVRACNLLVCYIITTKSLQEAHDCLLNVVLTIEQYYGKEKICPNLHLCLHLAECCLDYRPLYSFWCFSFERMNRILDKKVLLRFSK